MSSKPISKQLKLVNRCIIYRRSWLGREENANESNPIGSDLIGWNQFDLVHQRRGSTKLHRSNKQAPFRAHHSNDGRQFRNYIKNKSVIDSVIPRIFYYLLCRKINYQSLQCRTYNCTEIDVSTSAGILESEVEISAPPCR